MSERQGTCPECRRASAPTYAPFCSKRCADIDLGRWINGGYVIAGGNADADEDGDEAHSGTLPEDLKSPGER